MLFPCFYHTDNEHDDEEATTGSHHRTISKYGIAQLQSRHANTLVMMLVTETVRVMAIVLVIDCFSFLFCFQETTRDTLQNETRSSTRSMW